MKDFGIAISAIGMLAILVGVCESKDASDINANVAQMGNGPADFNDVIAIFGQPSDYRWGERRFEADELPVERYWMMYADGIHVFMKWNQAEMLEIVNPGYVFDDKIAMGSSLERVLSIVGQPKETVIGRRGSVDGVLYKNINGQVGWCQYRREDLNADFRFLNYSLSTVHIFLETKASSATGGEAAKRGGFQTAKPIESVKPYDDVRWKDLSKLDLSRDKRLIHTLTFNKKTIWPERSKMPAGRDPNKILTDAMNPGLGVRELHKQGITGKGVNVAIIDQPTYLVHPEFAGKIAAYHDTGCETDGSSMHGPGVASLLVGSNCGAAPDARVYYAAAPSWKKDSAYYAKGLDWIVEQNKKLPGSEKIRVVSVSAAPNQSSWANRQMWDNACSQAEADGIMVLDCTNSRRGFIGRCWYNARVPESVAQCNPGPPPNKEFRFNPNEIGILVPSSPRTTAEDGEYEQSESGYQYCGRGGLSWSIPYAAGILAMGWQVNPELSADQIRELLFESAYTKKNGAKIINPKKFIHLVTKSKVISSNKASQ